MTGAAADAMGVEGLCADCGRHIATNRWARFGGRHLCASCSTWRNRDICAGCGRLRRVQTRDDHGRAWCQSCVQRQRRDRETARQRDELAELIAARDPAVPRPVIVDALAEAAPDNKSMLVLHRLLVADPSLLHAPTRWAPKAPTRLITAVAGHAASTIVRPCCADCGTTKHARFRVPGGTDRLCQHCRSKRLPVPCATCGQTRPRWAGNDRGEPICARCDYAARRAGVERQRFPRSLGCLDCGIPKRFARSRCQPCAVAHEWAALCAGSPKPELLAAIGANVGSALTWRLVTHPAIATLIDLLGRDERLTHEGLDTVATRSGSDSWAIGQLRPALVVAGVLPERDESLRQITVWANQQIAAADLGPERVVAEQFLHWWILRRARNHRHRADPHQISLRRSLTGCLALLGWLHARQIPLAAATQADLDRWIARSRGRPGEARAFLRWAVRNKHCPSLLMIRRGPDPTPVSTITLDEQRRLVARLLDDDQLDVADRFAGLLVLLFAQLATRITRLPRSALLLADNTVELRLSSEPTLLPPSVEAVARDHAARVDGTGTPWLFPSPRDPRRSIGVTTLRRRLHHIGVTTAHRSAVMLDLARELPAPILRDSLGLHGNTAARWVTAAGGSWATYPLLHPAPGR
jgi:hypothetical protein